MHSNERFILIHKEGNSLVEGCRKIFVDKETGVNYLYIQSGYSGGLTVLLDADGKPVVTRFKETN